MRAILLFLSLLSFVCAESQSDGIVEIRLQLGATAYHFSTGRIIKNSRLSVGGGVNYEHHLNSQWSLSSGVNYRDIGMGTSVQFTDDRGNPLGDDRIRSYIGVVTIPIRAAYNMKGIQLGMVYEFGYLVRKELKSKYLEGDFYPEEIRRFQHLYGILLSKQFDITEELAFRIEGELMDQIDGKHVTLNAGLSLLVQLNTNKDDM